MPDDLPIVAFGTDAFHDHVLDHVVRSAGFRPVRVAPGEAAGRPHLVYGGEPPQDDASIWIRRDPSPVAWDRILACWDAPPEATTRIDVDLIRAVAELLSDAVNRDATPADVDDHGRLRFEHSWAARTGSRGMPIADLCMNLVADAITLAVGRRGRSRWPNGARACIALSHDVDEPDRYALLRSATRPWRMRRAPRTLGREAARLARFRMRDADPDAFWAFPELCRLEASYGFRSTFFFAATPFHAADGALEDVRYDVTDRRYRPLLAQLHEDGFGIGLHAGYRAHENPGQLERERRRLESVSGHTVIGVRHHYWRVGLDAEATLRAHEAAGFRYDSSLSFNEEAGFRRCASLPYRPWDRGEARAIRTWQLPPFCMDGNYFYRSPDVDAAVTGVGTLVDAIVRVGGFGSIDWHAQASVPRSVEFRRWGEAYARILERLALRDDVWVTSMENAHAWITERDRSLGGAS